MFQLEEFVRYFSISQETIKDFVDASSQVIFFSRIYKVGNLSGNVDFYLSSILLVFYLEMKTY